MIEEEIQFYFALWFYIFILRIVQIIDIQLVFEIDVSYVFYKIANSLFLDFDFCIQWDEEKKKMQCILTCLSNIDTFIVRISIIFDLACPPISFE